MEIRFPSIPLGLLSSRLGKWSGDCTSMSKSLSDSDDDTPKNARSGVQNVDTGLEWLREEAASVGWTVEQQESGQSGHRGQGRMEVSLQGLVVSGIL